jgi:hypothetical protein
MFHQSLKPAIGHSMKIITIRQPWAHLIVNGSKNIENRTWPTSYRGPVLIHASLNINRKACLANRIDPADKVPTSPCWCAVCGVLRPFNLSQLRRNFIGRK